MDNKKISEILDDVLTIFSFVDFIENTKQNIDDKIITSISTDLNLLDMAVIFAVSKLQESGIMAFNTSDIYILVDILCVRPLKMTSYVSLKAIKFYDCSVNKCLLDEKIIKEYRERFNKLTT